ncbi:hypothetical protein GOV07_02960, partial [Candidatus Woesearchaeota archaeon]|nr:hypothetical protein [Candidatus Woesearchaeota archaeon]
MRWVVKAFLPFLVLLIFFPGVLACNGDGVCDVGESHVTCGDCLDAYCGDLTCDRGLDEDDYGTGDWCPEDCGTPNGDSCSANGQCVSGNCCGAPSGTCVPQIYCTPPDTQLCYSPDPGLQSCSSSCVWGSCESVDCHDVGDCNDGEVCTIDSCSASYSCVNTERSDGTYCPGGNCESGSCEASCTTEPNCRSTAPAHSYEVTAGCPSNQDCYACNTGYTWNNGVCEEILSCSSTCT